MCGCTGIRFGLFGKYQLNEWMHLAEGNRMAPTSAGAHGTSYPLGAGSARGLEERRSSFRKGNTQARRLLTIPGSGLCSLWPLSPAEGNLGQQEQGGAQGELCSQGSLAQKTQGALMPPELSGSSPGCCGCSWAGPSPRASLSLEATSGRPRHL